MERHPFLSTEWMDEVRAIKQRHLGDPIDQPGVVANVVVTDVPFGDGVLEVRSTRGPMIGLEPGQYEAPDFSIRVRYTAARDLVLDRTPNALELALNAGDIEVEGDFDTFRDWWRARVGDEETRELEDEIRSVTA